MDNIERKDFNIREVANGYILTKESRSIAQADSWQDYYVFTDLNELSNFIKNLK